MKKLLMSISISTVLMLAVSAIGADKVIVIPLYKNQPPSDNKLIFLTTSKWTGNLGGISGADSKCNVEAKSLGHQGTFQAFLGLGSFLFPDRRSIHYPIPYVNADGLIVYQRYYNLSSGTLTNSISPNPSNVWTGLNNDGTSSIYNCQGWNIGMNLAKGSIGNSSSTSDLWKSNGVFFCDKLAALYCIEQ